MKKLMKKLSIYFLIFMHLSTFLFGVNLEEITYEEEINVSEVKLSDFLMFLSKDGSIEIIPENSIKSKNIDIFCKKGSSLKKILAILARTNDLQIIEENDYVFIAPRILSREGRGCVIGCVSSDEYNTKLPGVKVTLLDNHSPHQYTDINGNFYFSNIPYGFYFFRAEKKGYKIEGETLNINEPNNRIAISMEKETTFNKNNQSNSVIEENNFVIEKIKLSDVQNIDEKLLSDDLKKGVTFTKNIEKGIIYLSGERKKIAKIKKYFENLDGHKKQVRITAHILDVTENLFENLGFSWLYQHQGVNNINSEFLSGDNFDSLGSILSSTTKIFRNFNNKKDFLQMSFNMLKKTQDLKISAIPSIVTTNGQNGTFRITEERIIGQEKTENSDGKKTTYSPIFREAGIILNVVPEIMKDNSIILNIKLETSDFKMQNYDQSIDKDFREGKVSRNIETTVRLKNGETIFIGGLKKGIIQGTTSAVPFISSVPLVGELFKNKGKKNEVTDLFIQLKVDVIEDKGFSDLGMDLIQ